MEKGSHPSGGRDAEWGDGGIDPQMLPSQLCVFVLFALLAVPSQWSACAGGPTRAVQTQ